MVRELTEDFTNIQIRISKAEKDIIKKQARDNGFDAVSAYIRYLLRMERGLKNEK